jgi:hypothetical protein
MGQPKVIRIYEFGDSEVREQLLLHVFVQQDLQRTLPQTELVLPELLIIQYCAKQPSIDVPML